MLVKKFFTLLTVAFAIFFILVYTSQYSPSRELEIQTLTKLTKLPGIALSTGYLENRVIYYKDYSNQLYPQMKNSSKMDYVYAK